MTQELEKIQQRTRQYWYVDGLNEIGFGLFCLLLAGYFSLLAVLPDDSTAARWLNAGFILVILIGVLLLNLGIRWGKQRLTFPRTGYVSFAHQRHWQRFLVGGLAGLISAGLIVVIRFNRADFLVTLALNGLLFGGVWLYVAWKVGLSRFYAISLWSLVAGMALALSGLAENMALGLFYGLVAVGLVTSGIITLIQYLRHAPPLSQEENDEQ